MSAVTRRWVLGAGAASLAAGAGLVALARSAGSGRARDLLRRLEGLHLSPRERLRAHFPTLALGDEVLDRYLADHTRHLGPVGRFSLVRPDFFSRFLLSTDYFLDAGASADPSRPIRYVAFYDPYVSPCWNPAARPPPSDAELARRR